MFTLSFYSLNAFTQNTSLISNCNDFVSGPVDWPHVLVATTVDSGSASQGAQTFTMNVTSLPAGGEILGLPRQQRMVIGSLDLQQH